MNWNKLKAQGTIEYLVIIATVVVIALIAVGLFISVSSSPSQQIVDSSSKTGEVAVGGISIVESSVDPNGDSLIFLSNNSSDAITLKKISVGDVDNNFDNTLVGLDSKGFSLSGLSSACPCLSGQKSVKCEFRIEYLSATGITKTELRTINVQCVDDSTAVDEDKIIDPIDLSLSVLTLTSPSGSTSSKDVDFVFDLTKSNKIVSCTLYAGDDSNTYTDFVDGSNTLSYTFSSDAIFDWNIICLDTRSNLIQSDSLNLDVDSNAYQITTCLELQDMGLNLSGDYELMNDVNCSGIANFSPIGGSVVGALYYNCAGSSPFTGSLNGNNYTISNLAIDRTGGEYPTEEYLVCSALFGGINGANIHDLTIDNANIVATNWGTPVGQGSAGFIGYAANSTLSNLTLTNSSIASNSSTPEYGYEAGGIVASAYQSTLTELTSNNVTVSGGSVGGIIGSASSSSLSNFNTLNSTLSGNLNDSYNLVGGVVGKISRSDLVPELLLSNATFSGTVSGSGKIGGLVGGLEGHQDGASVENITNSGDVLGGYCAGSYFGAADVSVAYRYITVINGVPGSGEITGDYINADESTPYAGCPSGVGGGEIE